MFIMCGRHMSNTHFYHFSSSLITNQDDTKQLYRKNETLIF